MNTNAQIATQTQDEQEIITPPLHAVEECLNELAIVPKVPSWAKKRNVRDQFQYAFELIGGIPRLAHWAHTNPDKFFALYSKLIPARVEGGDGGPIQVQLSWINNRDTSGRSQASTIDVTPEGA